MSTDTSPSTIAFFGATGGSVGYALANALKNGHTCRTLTRSDPEKLKAALRGRGVSQQAIDNQLTALQGDAKDKQQVTATIRHNGKVVEKIVSGIGLQTFTFQFSIYPVGLSDPHVCESTLATIVQAASEIAGDAGPARPSLYVLSTTGISKGPRDVPILLWLIYKWLLKVMHDDKEKMEDVAFSAVKTADSPFDSVKVVRASLLVDGKSRGLDSIRTGTEAKPTVGYTIARADVGLWIYKRWLEPKHDGDETGAYTITY